MSHDFARGQSVAELGPVLIMLMVCDIFGFCEVHLLFSRFATRFLMFRLFIMAARMGCQIQVVENTVKGDNPT